MTNGGSRGDEAGVIKDGNRGDDSGVTMVGVMTMGMTGAKEE